jgi:hypothetical protein
MIGHPAAFQRSRNAGCKPAVAERPLPTKGVSQRHLSKAKPVHSTPVTSPGAMRCGFSSPHHRQAMYLRSRPTQAAQGKSAAEAAAREAAGCMCEGIRGRSLRPGGWGGANESEEGRVGQMRAKVLSSWVGGAAKRQGRVCR